METLECVKDSTELAVDSRAQLTRNNNPFFLRWGLEIHGISPTLMEDRVDKRLHQLFFVWFSANLNITSLTAGTAGPAFFNLGMRDSLAIILVVDTIACTIPAFLAIFGPKLGTRAMVQARFSFGYFGSIVPSILNVLTQEGYLILNCIIGGQTLAGVSDRLNDTVGIIIISITTLMVATLGYRVIHSYESLGWIPNALAFIVMLGVGGKHLHSSSFPTYPVPTVSTVLSFSSLIAALDVSWCIITSDYGVYHDSKASSFQIFMYSYMGFLTSNISGHMLGAAFAAAAPAVPSWKSGFDNGSNFGGLVAAILAPIGGFGKFLVVLLALSICTASAPTMYTFGTSFMSIAPIFARVPRYVFGIVSTVILIPISIIGATRFYTTLVEVTSTIGYWSAAFAGIILCEHFVFRRQNFAMYNVEDWDNRHRLPSGMAAVLSFAGSFGIIVPTMSQVWYSGPIAEAGTGDIGVYTGFVASSVLYLILRTFERRWMKNTTV